MKGERVMESEVHFRKKRPKADAFYFNWFIKALEEIPQTVIAGVDLSTADDARKQAVWEKVFEVVSIHREAKRKEDLRINQRRDYYRKKAARLRQAP
jgi:hypothetical protein